MACCGSYKKPVTAAKSNKGILIGTIIILLIYALLPETYRFSRAVTVLGAMWTMLIVNLIRYIMRKCNIGSTLFGGKDKRRIAVIGQSEETARVAALVRVVNKKCDFIGVVHSENNMAEEAKEQNNFQQLGQLNQLRDIISIYHINEVVFCSKDIPADNIITLMTELQDCQVEYKIAPEESESIIGSNSINTYDEICMSTASAKQATAARNAYSTLSVPFSCCYFSGLTSGSSAKRLSSSAIFLP